MPKFDGRYLDLRDNFETNLEVSRRPHRVRTISITKILKFKLSRKNSEKSASLMDVALKCGSDLKIDCRNRRKPFKLKWSFFEYTFNNI